MDTEATEPVTAVLFGLDGFRVLAGADAGGEFELMIETTADLVACPQCGAVATAKDRRPTWVGDLPIAGRPVVLCWVKRVWACEHALRPKRTWTETHEAIGPRAVLTARAATAAVAQVRAGTTVAGQARALRRWTRSADSHRAGRPAAGRDPRARPVPRVQARVHRAR